MKCYVLIFAFFVSAVYANGPDEAGSLKETITFKSIEERDAFLKNLVAFAEYAKTQKAPIEFKFDHSDDGEQK